MDKTKFNSEVRTLKNFFETYCKDKHEHLKTGSTVLKFKGEESTIELNLCDECRKNINYSFNRLEECPHEIKPKCRICPSPCYEKKQWKETAKVMKYSGMKLGLTKLKSKIKSFFN